MSILLPIILVCLYALVCLLFGLRLLRLAAPNLSYTSAENWLIVVSTAFLLGQAVLAAVWKLIALVGMFSQPIVIGLGIVAALSGINLILPLVRSLPPLVISMTRSFLSETVLWKVTILLALVPVIVYAIYTYMSPEPFGDGMAFYMAYSQLIAATGDLSIAPPLFVDFLRVGLQGELHFAVPLLFADILAPELFAWISSLAGVGVLMAFGDLLGMKARGKWILLAMAFSSSAFTVLLWDGKVDIFGAVIGLGAYYWAFQVTDDRGTAIRLSGLFTGFAIIAKISYAVFLPLSVVLIIVWRLYMAHSDDMVMRRFLPTMARVGLVLAFWGALPAIPHVIKNTVLFSEPLAPVIAANSESFVEQSWFTEDTTNRITVSYPFALTFGSFWAQGGNITPLFLMFIPLLFLLQLPDASHQDLIRQIILIALIAIGLWIFFRASVFALRYMFSPLLLFFIPLALAAERVSQNHPNQRLRSLIPLAICAVLAIFLFRSETNTRYAINTLLGRINECGLSDSRGDSMCRIGQTINAESEPGDRILNLTYFTYWYRPDLTQCIVGLPSLSNETNWQFILSNNVEYLVVNRQTHGQPYEQLMSNVPEWATLEPFFDQGQYQAFRIDIDETEMPTITYQCVEMSPNIWEVAEQTNTRDE